MNKTIEQTNKKQKKGHETVFDYLKSFFQKKPVKIFFVIGACLLLAFLVAERSPLGIWRDGEPSVDSSVFRYIGQEMVDGNIPYADTFDHKGPIIYILNWVGSLINPQRGIWLVELLSLFILSLISYRTMRLLKCGCSLSLLGVAALMLAIIPYFEDGNYTEEFAMPFIAGGLYMLIDFFINKGTKWWKVFICGICLGAVLLLRINMIPLWIVFGILILIDHLRKKDYVGIIKIFGWLVLGVAVIFVPILIWLTSNGAFNNFIEDYLMFNFSYASDGGMRARLNTLLLFIDTALVLTSLSISIYAVAKQPKKEKLLPIGILCSLILSLAIASMSGRPYMHYMMIMIPLLVYPFYVILQLHKNRGTRRSINTQTLLILFFSGVFILPCFINSVLYIKDNIKESTRGKPSETTLAVRDVVLANSTSDDKIAVYGSWDDIYLKTDRRSASKYSYTYALAAIKPEEMHEYFDELEKEKPALVVTQGSYLKENFGNVDYMLFDFLRDNNYKIIWEEKDENGIPTGTSVYSL